jgi:hypothetical protein
LLFLFPAAAFLAAAVLVGALVPETTYAYAPVIARLGVAVAFHLLAALVAARLLLSPTPALPPVLLWLWLNVGLAGTALCRGSGVVYGALCAPLLAALLCFVFHCLNSERTAQQRRLRTALGAALLLSAYGLVVLSSASTLQLAAQMPWFCLSWLVIAHPWSSALIRRLLRAPRNPRVRIRALFGAGVLLMLGNLGYKWAAHSDYPSVVLGGISFQPFLGAFFLFLLAEAVPSGASQSEVGKGTAWRAMAVTALYGALGEGGMLTVYWLVLLLYLVIRVGLLSRPVRQISAIGLLFFLLALGLAYVPIPGLGPVRSHLSYVRDRVAFVRGDSGSNAELARVNAAVSHGGALGQMGASGAWLISRKAARDYSLAVLIVNMGYAGLATVTLLYAAMLGGLFNVALKSRGPTEARQAALMIVLVLSVQTVLPLAASFRSFTAIGIPALGIGRGGTYFLCFALSLAVLAAVGQMTEEVEDDDAD